MSNQSPDITPAESEYLVLATWFIGMLEKWEKEHRLLKEKERSFLNLVQSTAAEVKQSVTQRALKQVQQEQKEHQWLHRVKEPCPKCDTTRHCKVTGTTKNTFGHTIREMHCTTCKQDYFDYEPIYANDKADWVKRLGKTLKKVSKQENLPQNLLDMIATVEEKGDDYIASKKTTDAAIKELEAAKASYQAKLQELANQLLTIKMDTSNWGKHIGSA